MPLIEGQFSKQLNTFITNVNAKPIKDQAIAITNYCDMVESLVYNAIKSATIRIIPGEIITVGSPTTQTNVIPIILEGNIE
jgi:peptidoglycan biosynthesis protein MviN/MurJ (putative lipid II flippase)